MLYHYLPELEAYRKATRSNVCDENTLNALNLLISIIKDIYKSTTERLAGLIVDGKITYDLLWALFKANSLIFTICRGSRKPRCLRYDFGEETKNNQGMEYFELQCRSLDFDGEVFGEIVDKLRIEKFHGAKRIDTLDVFPIKYHPTQEKMREYLRECGRKFESLLGSHHRYYQGYAFLELPKGTVRIRVKSRIIIDAGLFRKNNPSYPRLYTKKADGVDLSSLLPFSQSPSERVTSNNAGPDEMTEDDLLICPATVLGFSLDDKFWGELRLC